MNEEINESNVDKYRKKWETEDLWALRREFILLHKDKFDLIRLLCLSQMFINIETMDTVYNQDLMALVQRLASELQSLQAYRDNRKAIVNCAPQKRQKTVNDFPSFSSNSNITKNWGSNSVSNAYNHNRHSDSTNFASASTPYGTSRRPFNPRESSFTPRRSNEGSANAYSNERGRFDNQQRRNDSSRRLNQSGNNPYPQNFAPTHGYRRAAESAPQTVNQSYNHHLQSNIPSYETVYEKGNDTWNRN